MEESKKLNLSKHEKVLDWDGYMRILAALFEGCSYWSVCEVYCF